MGRSAKGSAFERQIARELSEWFTCGRRSDVFWRIPGSGGRATIRGKLGRTTSGQYGDIQATHPKAAPLLRLFTLELKRGHSARTPFDCLDRRPDGAVQIFESWCVQVMEAASYAKTPLWLLISKRDQRLPVASFPQKLLTRLAGKDLPSFHNLLAVTPRQQMTFGVRMSKQVTLSTTVVSLPLHAFFLALSPRDVLALLEKPK